MKGFLLSKINWLGLVTIFVALQDFIGNWDFSQMTVKSWVTFAIGMVIIIIRTWFTTNPEIKGMVTLPEKKGMEPLPQKNV